MKQLKRLSIIAVLLAATVVLAQQWQETLISTGPLAAHTITNPNVIVTMTKYEDLDICLKSIGDASASGSGKVICTFQWSANGIDYVAAPVSMTTTGAADGTPQIAVSNFNLGPVGFLKLTVISNACDAVMTGIVTVATKPNRFWQ